MNLYEIFHETARRQPEHPAILGPGVSDSLSYRALNDAVEAVAGRLAAAGVTPGDCVGLHCPSGADYIILNYAVWRCGGCVVPVPVELAAGEKQEICREIALNWLIAQEKEAGFAQPFRPGPCRLGPGRRAPAQATDLSPTATLFPVNSPREHPAGFAAINAAFIRFTSGTTGSSKGVVLSHETIFERFQAANEALAIGPDDRVVWVLSMSYHFAVSIVGYLSLGAAIVLPRNHFAGELIGATRRCGGTLIYASPMHYALMADSRDAAPLSGLRLAVSTTASLKVETARTFHRRFGLPIAQALGIIEVGLPCINVDFATDRPDGVGRVLPAYSLRADDAGLGPNLKEILFKGPGCLDAYYEPWRTREEIMPDGWFRTGDVAELDADGCLFIRGRSNDVINVAGMKFFPQETESVLASHPAVAEACVFAVRDDRLGEVPHARVVPERAPRRSASESELIEYCRQRLAGYKIPARIEFVDRLPRTASGKVLHREPPPRRLTAATRNQVVR